MADFIVEIESLEHGKSQTIITLFVELVNKGDMIDQI